jgi:hypothetical protein
MPNELSESDILVLLADRRRRLTLRTLQGSATPLTAIEIARRTGDHEHESPSDEDYRRIYLALYHVHLPRLEEADVVEYNRKVGTVRPGVNFDALVDKGLVEKGRTDDRTNSYSLTGRGLRELEARREWEEGYVDGL